MCGIAGIFSSSPIEKQLMNDLTCKLGHRGPDATGFFFNETATVGLGHTRLSIIDLSSAANQPLISYDERYAIVFNGEIYNYKTLRDRLFEIDPALKLKTDSDTEIILAGYSLWGNAVCEKLEGMFAFAIYDRLRNEIFLCRDRLGKKPIFYFHDRAHFIFASEIKSLREHPVVRNRGALNRNAIANFLHLGFIPEPDSIYESIGKFPAGSFAVVKDDFSIDPRPYWKIEQHIEKRPWTLPLAMTSLGSHLSQAVERRLVSDVPLGAFLSGGTDSSLVAAMASKLKTSPLKTFTIGFKESKFDESQFARQVATHLRTDHHEYILAEQEAVEILEKYIGHFDEPFADTSAIPTMLVSRLARKEVTVALTGDGGDELFLGYGAYDWANRLGQGFFKAVQAPLAFALRSFGNSRLKRISFLLEKVSREQRRSHIFSQEQYFFTEHEISSRLLTRPAPLFRYADPDTDLLNEAEKQALFDIRYYLKDDLLVKVDRASMYYGLECRSPFLDHHVVELAMSMPYEFKKRNGQRKWILKELMKEHFPDDLINRPKWGFSVPLARWLKKDLSYLVDRYLSREMTEHLAVVKYSYVEELKQSFNRGDDFLYNRLWLLIVLHKWLYENPAKG